MFSFLLNFVVDGSFLVRAAAQMIIFLKLLCDTN